jgi:hypothetical protein
MAIEEANELGELCLVQREGGHSRLNVLGRNELSIGPLRVQSRPYRMFVGIVQKLEEPLRTHPQALTIK